MLSTQRKYKLLHLQVLLKDNAQMWEVQEDDFMKFTGWLRNKERLMATSEFLQRMNSILELEPGQQAIELKPQFFLTAYMTKQFPDVITEEEVEKDSLPDQLFKMSHMLVNLMQELVHIYQEPIRLVHSVMVEQFRDVYNTFFTLFTMWKHKDATELIEGIANQYANLDKSIKFIEERAAIRGPVTAAPARHTTGAAHFVRHADDVPIAPNTNPLWDGIVANMKALQLDLVKKIKQIDRNFNIEYLQNYVAMTNQVQTTFQQAFWDQMTEQINNQNFDLVIANLRDIQEQLLGLVPNRTDLQQEMAEHFDVDLIAQMIENHAFTPDVFKLYTRYVILKIRELQAEDRDEQLDQTLAELMTHFDGEVNFAELVPTVLRAIFDLLDQTTADINLFRLSGQQVPAMQ